MQYLHRGVDDATPAFIETTNAEDRTEPGRPAQRRRTRNAIVAAAAGLLAAGKTPSVAEVAEAADVSRRTVYMYFPTLEHLFLDATLGSLASTAAIGATIDEHASDEEIEARVERLARLVQRGAAETEQQGRTLLRLTVQGANDGAPRPPRGYRRVEWVEGIVAPLGSRVGNDGSSGSSRRSSWCSAGRR